MNMVAHHTGLAQRAFNQHVSNIIFNSIPNESVLAALTTGWHVLFWWWLFDAILGRGQETEGRLVDGRSYRD